MDRGEETEGERVRREGEGRAGGREGRVKLILLQTI